ncbi:hypothetical protein [Paracoccus pacificus]|uniref:Uncharacterized protein n=1 Tax=Paracoccus pacificus TaxID=1463598 RepID=A0ABW4R6I1_9RHOB
MIRSPGFVRTKAATSTEGGGRERVAFSGIFGCSGGVSEVITGNEQLTPAEWVTGGAGMKPEDASRLIRWAETGLATVTVVSGVAIVSEGGNVLTATRVATNNGTVWDNITSTAGNLPNTNVPVTFKLKSGEYKFYVNSNATKHMGEYLQKSSNPINDQRPLRSFFGAGDEISSSGSVKFGQIYNVNGWEIIFNQRFGDSLPVINHALYTP